MRAEARFEPEAAPPPPPLQDGRSVLAGVLEQQDRALPVQVTFASGISLYVAFPGERAPDDLSIFTRLLLQLPQGEIALSRCRFHAERQLDGVAGRLVFLDDVYDCKSLVEGKVISVRTFMQNVPLVLTQKDAIQPAFREYVANVLYDLSIYKRFFDAQDKRILDEPEHVALAAEASLLANEGRAFFRDFDAKLAELDALVADFDNEQHAQHGFYLRCLAWDYILGVPLYRRTNVKPRGYAGDAEMMIMLYENAYAGASLLYKLMHKHAVETTAAEAVRGRRPLVAQAVREAAAGWEGEGERFRFASIAAGPACELQEIFRTEADVERLGCVLVDQDPYALALAREGVERIERGFPGRKLDVGYVTESVRTMLRKSGIAERLGQFHFVYSMGLFDYLTPPVAAAVLRRLYGLLVPGGTLLVGNFHVGNPTRNYMAYWADWVLCHRTEDELHDLAAGLPGARASLGFDPTCCQMFLKLVRER